MEEMIGMVAVVLMFGLPIVAILTGHQRKMMEIRQRNLGTNDQISSELKEIRAAVAELRETTTRYDLSFDTALQRLEGRMSAVENRVANVENAQSAQVRQG